jgi:hypothetical protein
MSDHKHRAYQATGSETLEKLVMDPNIPKSETEGWACREIERLRARVEVLERACRLIEGDPDPHAVAECIGCYRHSRLAYHALEAKP